MNRVLRRLRLSQAQRVHYLNELRRIVGLGKPKNKAGHPIVSDFDLINADDHEHEAALLKAETDP
jgi:hypothetical protein